jgi:preprotein translocase subunit YajC
MGLLILAMILTVLLQVLTSVDYLLILLVIALVILILIRRRRKKNKIETNPLDFLHG